MFRILALLLLTTPALAGVDAKAIHAQLVALDGELGRAIAAKDLQRYRAAREKAQRLAERLGSDPTEPCRTAAIHLESSRSGEWFDRQRQALSATDKRIAEANRRDYLDALAACKGQVR